MAYRSRREHDGDWCRFAATLVFDLPVHVVPERIATDDFVTILTNTVTVQVREVRRMRVVGYVRVSTSAQAEEGYGLDVQRTAIRRWAKEQGHRLVGIESDEGVSGALAAQDREGLCHVLDIIRSGQAAGLVVHRLDRLARLLAVQEATLALVWRHDGAVYEVSGGEVLRDDPDDPMRKALRQMLGVFGELERGTLTARMRAGRRQKAAAGGYAGGAPPFGWTATNKALVHDAAEYRAIQRARTLRAEGNSLRAIADRLASEGHVAKRGGPWHPETLRRLLARA